MNMKSKPFFSGTISFCISVFCHKVVPGTASSDSR